MQSPDSDFTPLHWAAIHGANNIITALIAAGAKQSIPDKEGLFPIDYAGVFKHEHTVNLLIFYQLESIKELKKHLPMKN